MCLHPIHFCSHVTGLSKFHGCLWGEEKFHLLCEWRGDERNWWTSSKSRWRRRNSVFVIICWMTLLPRIASYRTLMSRTKVWRRGNQLYLMSYLNALLSTLLPSHASISPLLSLKTFPFSWRPKAILDWVDTLLCNFRASCTSSCISECSHKDKMFWYM